MYNPGKSILIDCQPIEEKEAPDLSFAFIRALQCCIFLLRIKVDPFQMLTYLLHVSSQYAHELIVKRCCSLRTSRVTIPFTMFG